MSVTQIQQQNVRLVFLNALPINAFKSPPLPPKFTLHVYNISIHVLKSVIDDMVKPWNIPIINYIRHEATVRYLNEKLSLNLTPSSGLYEHQRYDVLVVITLKRPERGREITEIKDEDLDIYLVEVLI